MDGWKDEWMNGWVCRVIQVEDTRWGDRGEWGARRVRRHIPRLLAPQCGDSCPLTVLVLRHLGVCL